MNTHRVPSVDVLLDVISDRIGLINGAKKIYTTGGTLIKDINKIRDGEVSALQRTESKTSDFVELCSFKFTLYPDGLWWTNPAKRGEKEEETS